MTLQTMANFLQSTPAKTISFIIVVLLASLYAAMRAKWSFPFSRTLWNCSRSDARTDEKATLSTGERISNPRHQESRLRELAHAQRDLARRKKGSGRRNRARLKVARIQKKIADTRNDHLHKLTTDLVRRFDFLAIEDLNVRGMTQMRSLARSISDVSFGMFRSMLEYKAKWYGKEVIAIDRFYPSSKTCSDCGWVNHAMTLSTRDWTCEECGAKHDRDENAARNILAVGRTVTARGGGVRLKRTPVRKNNRRRNVKRQGAA